MSLIPYYLQYVSEICEGTRKAPAGIVLTEQEDLKKALQLQAEITKLGIPAFVKACAEADGTEIPQEEYDSFDPAELNTAIAQLAAASQPQEPAEEAPKKTELELLIERIQKIQQELPAHNVDISPEEQAFTQAAVEQREQMGFSRMTGRNTTARKGG